MLTSKKVSDIDAIDSVIQFLVLEEANPIPGLLLPPVGEDLSDVFSLFLVLPTVICTNATFKCVTATFPHYICAISTKQRSQISEIPLSPFDSWLQRKLSVISHRSLRFSSKLPQCPVNIRLDFDLVKFHKLVMLTN
jgi:hypothetical protein